ncbi:MULTISPECIES: fimbrial protein [Serratia]|uniref:fimbrial protein n=1 Tax=Serratia TaxID=613 RepID=UPI00236138A5|nr:MULTISPECIES: fimbrial protein [Serratia]
MKRVIIALLLAGMCGASQAKDGEADMTFHGTLIAPPDCTLNDGELIDVDFGEQVGIGKVDGNNYRQKVNYQITCERQSAGNEYGSLSLSLEGVAAAFDAQALGTDRADLGIRIYQDGTPFAPNTRIDIELANPPELNAVPVKRPGATLEKGTFEAWATLLAEYQ